MQAEYSETKLLAMPMTSGVGLLAKKPVHTLEDLAGMKIASAGKWSAEQIKAWGAAPVGMNRTDILMALQTGVVDGAIANWVGTMPVAKGGDAGWGQFAKYFTEVNTFNTPFYVAMNLQKWNSLPPDIQKAIETASGEPLINRYNKYAWETETVKNKKISGEDYGVESIWLTPDEMARWSKIMTGIQAQFVNETESKGKPAKKLMEEYLRLCKKYKLEGYYGAK